MNGEKRITVFFYYFSKWYRPFGLNSTVCNGNKSLKKFSKTTLYDCTADNQKLFNTNSKKKEKKRGND